MANYGQANFKVEFDATDGGALTDISQYVTEINEVTVERLTEESDAFGDSWREHLMTGIRTLGDITITGFYEDATVDAIFTGTHAVTRSLKLTWGGTKTTAVETWIASYTRTASRGALTKYSATLRPTGAVVEA
jgi:hypothetical protein